jgi:magnesium transporter
MLPTEHSDNISVEQISFLIKECLISFQERSDFLFISENESVTIQETSGQKKRDFFTLCSIGCHYRKFLYYHRKQEDKGEIN